MKDQFLKIAGVKTEAAFYKKYKTEKDFFSAHPEAKKMVKKAQAGTIMSGMSSYLQGMQGAQNVPNMQNVIQGQMQSPGVNAGMFSGPQVDNSVSTINASQLADNKSGYVSPGGPNTNVEKMNKIGEQIGKYAPMVGSLVQGYQSLRAGRRAKKEAQKWAGVTGVMAGAAESIGIDDYRQYAESADRRRNAMMPVTTGEEFFPVYGVGTNVLARNGARLQDGGMIGGNPTEIQNTYAPGTLYDDLGYEPLDDSNQVKQFAYGGRMMRAQQGAELFSPSSGGMSGGTPWGMIGGMGSDLAGSIVGKDGGSQIGGTIGGAAGSMFGPAGQAIGQIAGTAIGGLLDTNDRDQRKAEAKIRNNQNRMMAAQYRGNLQSQFSGYMEDGGNVNPQIISKLGGNNLMSLLAPPNDADMLRAGGHIRGRYVEPNESGLSTMEQGGDLATHWGGYAEPMSYNPYLPDGGETVMFRGQSHDESDGMGNTGIGVSYGNTDEPNVEVERGEPAVKLRDGGTGEENLTVYGNLMIPNYGVDILGDKKAKGKKFKSYIAGISKMEDKQNKLVEKSTDELDALDIQTPFDKLKLSSLEANILGGNMKLKDVADKKIKAADIQNAINETAEEYSLVADDLAKGKVKFDKEAMKAQAKYGAAIEKADKGKKLKSVSSMENVPKGQRRNEQTGFWGKVTPEMFEKMKERKAWYDWENFDPKDKSDVLDFQGKFNALAKAFGKKGIQYDGDFGEQTASADSSWFKSRERGKDLEAPVVPSDKKDDVKTEENKFEIIKNKKNPWINLGYQTLKGILDRPYEEELSPDQLMGEYYAMSANQVEPVQATPYSPQLRVPYDISLQDQINQITSDQRATQKMMGYNPAAQAMVASQAYDAKSKVLADQFRANQAMKDQVYSGNIATLNDAELKNLAIYDQQYTRQEQAKSNTKAIAQAALSSIGDKLAKHKADVREYNVYKTLFPQYGFERSGRGRFEGGYADFNTPQSQYPFYNNPNYALVKNSDGTFTYKLKDQVTEDDQVVEQPVQTPVQTPSGATPSFNPNAPVYEDDEYEYILKNKEAMDEVAPKRAGGKIRKNYSQSSIVKAFK